MKILDFPLIRITFWFIIGIIVAYHSNLDAIIGKIVLSIAIIFFLLQYFKTNKKIKQNPGFALSSYLLFFAIGINSVIISNPTFKKTHYTKHSRNFEKQHAIKIQIQDKLKSTQKYNRYIASIKSIDQIPNTGKIMLNIIKDKSISNLNTGTKLIINDQLVENFKPNNPNQFDYGDYLKSKGIHAQIFTEVQHIKINSETAKDIWYYSAVFRNKITDNLSKSGFRKEELAVITALILGQQQDISQDVLRDYQYAGAVHILSVSGLHVGFILLFITFLLKPLPNNKTGNIVKIILTLLSLWIFAIIAGFSPSVIRSATMFSFIAVGKFMNRETNSFHTTVVSMFLILMVEPLFLFDIGFQLSYLAVFFILWLQPILQKVWKPENRVLSYFWDILTVSFAAQIGTLPLSIYYFHQFPGLFFITNLILIPLLGFVIMPLGTLLILFAFFDWVPQLLSKLVETSILIMNQFISWIASLESFIWKEIPLNTSLLLISYAAIITWIFWFEKPNFKKLAWAMGSVIAFQLMYTFIQWNEQTKTELIVFNTRNKSVLAEKKGTKIKLLSNDTITADSFEYRMLQTYATANFSTMTQLQSLPNCLYFNHKKILIVDQSNAYKISDKADVLILSHSPKINIERLFTLYKPEIVIADASNYKTYVQSWKAVCQKNKIPFHSTYEKGFYKL